MKHPSTFLSMEDAAQLVRSHLHQLPSETVSLDSALGRSLVQSVRARTDQPRFRKAAVDGYALAESTGSGPYRVTATIAAGDEVDPRRRASLGRGEALRIMTGAVVPPDIQRVVRFEYTEEIPAAANTFRILRGERNTNIAEQGENIRSGATLLTPRILSAIDIGILASQGVWTVFVARLPAVAVISTGTELVHPSEPYLADYAIYESNGMQLSALAAGAGAQVHNYGIAADRQEGVTKLLGDAAANHNLVVCSGGVSMGDKDFVPTALEALGAEIHFHGLAMKPGRPTLFATLNDTLVFGLPGNPVSTVVQFEMFIAPTIAALQGAEYLPREAHLPLIGDFQRSSVDRAEFLPGVIRDGAVEPVPYMGSGHLSALATAEVVFRVDRGVATVNQGEAVYVRYLR